MENSHIKESAGCYAIKLLDDIIYIGASKNIKKRCRDHFRHLKAGRHHSKKLQDIFNDKNNELTFFVLEYCDISDIFKKETEYIKKAKPICNSGYGCEFLSIEQISEIYGIPTHQARRCLQGKASAIDVKIVDKNRKLYSETFVISVIQKPVIQQNSIMPPIEKQHCDIDLYRIKISYLKLMVMNLERENAHLLEQNKALLNILTNKTN